MIERASGNGRSGSGLAVMRSALAGHRQTLRELSHLQSEQIKLPHYRKEWIDREWAEVQAEILRGMIAEVEQERRDYLAMAGL